MSSQCLTLGSKLLTSNLIIDIKSNAFNETTNPSYGLVDKERHRNRRLFGLHGVGSVDKKYEKREKDGSLA